MLKAPQMVELNSVKIDESLLIRPIDSDHVENLKKNIEVCGQITPIIVEEYKDRLYHVVAHAHEFRALQSFYDTLKKKNPALTPKILTRRFEGSEKERKMVQLSENIMHKTMSMEEIGKQVDELLKMDKSLTQTKIGDELGWSQSYISECLNTFKGKPKNREPTMTGDDKKLSTVDNLETQSSTEEGETEETGDIEDDKEPISEEGVSDEEENETPTEPTETPPIEDFKPSEDETEGEPDEFEKTEQETEQKPEKKQKSGEEKLLFELERLKETLVVIAKDIGEPKRKNRGLIKDEIIFTNNQIFKGAIRKLDAKTSWTAELDSLSTQFNLTLKKLRKRIENRNK